MMTTLITTSSLEEGNVMMMLMVIFYEEDDINSEVYDIETDIIIEDDIRSMSHGRKIHFSLV